MKGLTLKGGGMGVIPQKIIEVLDRDFYNGRTRSERLRSLYFLIARYWQSLSNTKQAFR